MLRFEYSSVIAAPVERVFAFHQRPDALELLTPPRPRVEVVRRTGGILPGALVELRIHQGPFRVTWLAEHGEYIPNRLFTDFQTKGPFRVWRHRHQFEAAGDATRLTDSIEFSLPLAPLSDWLGGWLARIQLRHMFEYRHRVTRQHCESA
jgi:ligand-binding SRPBCC domain-containing protein